MRHLTYSNVVATVAIFLAMGGGAYAISVPRNSVGPRQLKNNAVTAKKVKRGAVTSAKVKDRSLSATDLQVGIVGNFSGATGDETDPAVAPGAVIRQTALTTATAGRIFVIGTLRDPFLTCSEAGPCSARWGIYVDERPVSDTGLALQASAGASDGLPHQTLFGVTPVELLPGQHTVKFARTDSGAPESVGQLGAQVGAFAPDG